jgi:hypothetical protein
MKAIPSLPQGMKGVLALALPVLVCAQAAETPTPAGPPKAAHYYSAQRLSQGVPLPPLPANPFPELPVYPLDEWNFVFDDREVDYDQLRREAGDAPAAATQSLDRGAALEALGDCASELQIYRGSNTVTLTITNATEGRVFDLYRTFELLGDAITNSFWLWVTNGSNGQSFTFPTCPCPRVFYVLGCTNDTDGDGLSDAFEVLVNKTSPLTNHSVNALYTDREMVNILVNDPEQDCGNEQNTQDETAVIAFGNTVVAAWVDSNLGVPGYGVPDEACNNWRSAAPPRFIGWAVSTNGGQAFADKGAPPMITNNGNIFGVTAGDPVLGYDAQSNIVYLVGNPKRPSVYSLDGTNQHFVPLWRSADGGQTFSDPINVVPGLTDPATNHYADKPAIAVDNFPGNGQGNAYVAVYLENRIYVYRSTDRGRSWQALTNLGFSAFGPQLAVGPNHDVYLAWREVFAGVPRFAFAKSSDLGTNFAANSNYVVTLNSESFDLGLRRSNMAETGDKFRTPLLPVLAANPAHTNHLYLVYNDSNTSDKADIFLAQSTDGGGSWTNIFRVNNDTTTNDQWQPAITVKPDGTQVFIGWYDRRNDDPASNSLIQVYGVVSSLPVLSTNAFVTNFPISTVQFPAAFTGTAMTNAGTFDPAYPPAHRNDGTECPNFNGNYAPHMGDYDIPFADNAYIYYTWADNRATCSHRGGLRHQADIRFFKIPWLH